MRISRLTKTRVAKQELASMHVQRWVIFAAVFVTTVLPAGANSTGSVPHELLAGTNNQMSARGQGGLLFRDTIRDEWRNSTGIPTAHWDSASSAEIPSNQERVAILPEPGSGILLLIGVLALTYSRRGGFAHSPNESN
jgi:hypothetical protein